MALFLLHPDRTDRRVTFVSLAIAFALATIFYKFGSFALECLAFLATWALIDVPAQWARQVLGRRDERKAAAGHGGTGA